MSKRRITDRPDECYTSRLFAEFMLHIIRNKEAFYNKIVYCPCDTEDSEIVKALQRHKDELGLKAVFYSGLPEHSFDSDYAIELMKQSDIIITNPPFSKFSKLYKQIRALDKHFLLFCSMLSTMSMLTKNEIALSQQTTIANHAFTCKYTLVISDNSLLLNKFLRPNGEIENVPFSLISDVFDLEQPILFASTRKSKAHYYAGNESHYTFIDGSNILHVKRYDEIPVDYDEPMYIPVVLDCRKMSAFNILPIDRYLLPLRDAGKNLFHRLKVQWRPELTLEQRVEHMENRIARIDPEMRAFIQREYDQDIALQKAMAKTLSMTTTTMEPIQGDEADE